MDQALEILASRSGAVVLGWLARDVFYLRLTGKVAGSLGAKCEARLARLLTTRDSIRCFLDGRSPTDLDIQARSSLVRAFLAGRGRLRSMTVLSGCRAVADTVVVLDSMLGGIVRLTVDAEDFDQALLGAAPFATLKLRELEDTSLQGSVRWRVSAAPGRSERQLPRGIP